MIRINTAVRRQNGACVPFLSGKKPGKKHMYELLTKCRSNGWILAKLFFLRVYKHAKTQRGQYPAILTEQAWSIEDFLYGFRGNFSCGTRLVVPRSSILPITAKDLIHLARSRSWPYIKCSYVHILCCDSLF